MVGIMPIASPLTTLNQKNVKYKWSEACENSSKILKYRLTSALVLTLPKDSKGFVVYCYESRVGLGHVLIQHGKVIDYASSKLRCMRETIQLMILN